MKRETLHSTFQTKSDLLYCSNGLCVFGHVSPDHLNCPGGDGPLVSQIGTLPPVNLATWAR